jgi:hypothetical protein
MTTKTKTCGGTVTRDRYGPEYYRAIGRKGAATTNAKHADKLSGWASKGLEKRIERRWNGDRAAYFTWLAAKGSAATDPFPANGAFPDPGPEPVALDELLDRDFIDCCR